jgi:zinc transport system ATP-binding protein
MVIEARELTVTYGPYTALQDVSFTVERGDFLAVIGPNGSGKTTLIRAILGLVQAARGTILLNGLSPAAATRQEGVGYLPQKAALSDPRFPATVHEVILSGLALHRGEARPETEVRQAMQLLRVGGLGGRRVGELSGGQQQRVHLARALVRRPRLLVLDEPTGALDPESRECFYETLVDINAQQGVTVILVSHDIESVSRAARSVLYLDRALRFHGSVEDFTAKAGEHYFGEGHRHGACREDA